MIFRSFKIIHFKLNNKYGIIQMKNNYILLKMILQEKKKNLQITFNTITKPKFLSPNKLKLRQIPKVKLHWLKKQTL